MTEIGVMGRQRATIDAETSELEGADVNLRERYKRIRGIAPNPNQEALDSLLDGDVECVNEADHRQLRIVEGKQVICSLWVLDFSQQIRNSVVKMAGIAAVETHPEHRQKGHCRRLMRNALRWARQNGYDTSQLFGIPTFYPKFGYVQAFPYVRFSITVRDAEVLHSHGHRIVRYAPKFLQILLRIHQRNNLGRTGPIRRDPKQWQSKPGFGRRRDVRVLLNRSGTPAGYFVFEAETSRLTVVEAGWSSEMVLPDIVLAAAGIAAKLRLESVNYLLPEDHLLMDFCRPLRLWQRVTHRKDSGAQVRLVSVATTLTKLAKDIGTRLAGSGSLNIHTNLDDARISWSDGSCTVDASDKGKPVVQMPQWALAQLVYGYRTARSLKIEGAIRGTATSTELLDQMFPRIPHFFYAVDEF